MTPRNLGDRVHEPFRASARSGRAPHSKQVCDSEPVLQISGEFWPRPQALSAILLRLRLRRTRVRLANGGKSPHLVFATKYNYKVALVQPLSWPLRIRLFLSACVASVALASGLGRRGFQTRTPRSRASRLKGPRRRSTTRRAKTLRASTRARSAARACPSTWRRTFSRTRKSSRR